MGYETRYEKDTTTAIHCNNNAICLKTSEYRWVEYNLYHWKISSQSLPNMWFTIRYAFFRTVIGCQTLFNWRLSVHIRYESLLLCESETKSAEELPMELNIGSKCQKCLTPSRRQKAKFLGIEWKYLALNRLE